MLFLLDCPAGFRQAFIRLTQIDTRPFSRWQLSSSLTLVFLLLKIAEKKGCLNRGFSSQAVDFRFQQQILPFLLHKNLLLVFQAAEHLKISVSKAALRFCRKMEVIGFSFQSHR